MGRLKPNNEKARNKINPREMHKSYLDKMESSLEKEGVVFFDTTNSLNIDSNYLCLPEDITEVSPKELGKYLSAFTQHKIYLRTLLGRAELVSEEKRRVYFSKSLDLYKRLSREKLSETAKDRIIVSSPDVEEYYIEYLDSKSKVNLLKYNIESVEDAIFLISREVTRRTADFAEQNRDYRYGSES